MFLVSYDVTEMFLVSYDVTSLFTNIPLTEAIDFPVNAIFESSNSWVRPQTQQSSTWGTF